MATKAELEAELEVLRAKLAEPRPTESDPPEASPPSPDKEQRTETDMLASIFKDHDIQSQDLEELWKQFLAELDGFPQRKPLLTAAAAFALGFVLGRATK